MVTMNPESSSDCDYFSVGRQRAIQYVEMTKGISKIRESFRERRQTSPTRRKLPQQSEVFVQHGEDY
jgi:hypothetical protein